MKFIFTSYISLFFLTITSAGVFSQKLSLKLTSSKKYEVSLLNKLNYEIKHLNKKTIYSEIDSVLTYLNKIGYLSNKLDSVSKKDSIYSAFIKIGAKTQKAIITIPKNTNLNFSSFKLKGNTVFIPFEKLESLLKSISNQLDKNGASFSEVQLKNIQLNGKNLIADLSIKPSLKRTIDKVILKGYEKFPKSYIKHYLNIEKKSIFNRQKLTKISSSLKSLTFVKEVKPPEVLFTKDSTLLYIYVKKSPNNSFDGLVNFTSNENGKALFNGHLDLQLNNMLDTGERFKLFWNSIGEERQSFKVAAENPYILNSPFSTIVSFNIYKQDSTFLNTKFHGDISYGINPRTKVLITYDIENSKELEKNTSNKVTSFGNYFLGLGFSYQILNESNLFQKKLDVLVNTSFGNRTIENQNTSQFKILFSMSYLFDFSSKSKILIKNETGYLNSNDFTENEIFRIGGANSIRGFKEQSVFTSKYSYFNIEYRYLTSQKSYLYSITDIGNFQNFKAQNKQYLIGLGIGYLFTKKNNQFNINYSIPKIADAPFNFKTSQIILGWTSFF